MTVLRLPHGETDERRRYTLPDPDALTDAYARAYRDVYYESREPDIADVKRLLMLARGYLDLTTYVLGQETCVGKLRDVWRARRARKSEAQ